MLSSAVNQLCRQCRYQIIRVPLQCSRTVIPKPLQADIQLQHWLQSAPVRFAGHAHWQNIKKIKMTKDDQKQRLINLTLQRIRVAVREGGGSLDPNVNSQLARAIDDGKARDVPNTTMFQMLRKMEKSKDAKGSVVYIEGRALSNCLLIIELFTEKPKKARADVQHILKKFGLKGVIYVPNDGDKTMSTDEAEVKAIEAGAEEVVDGFDDEDRPVLKFISDEKELHTVKRSLEDGGLEIVAARLEFIPRTLAMFEGKMLDLVGDLHEALKGIDEVVRVYDNAGSADEAT